MLSKSMRCTDNCNAFSWYWSTEWAKIFTTTMPNHTLHNQCFKSQMNWATKFCLIHHIHLTSCQLTTTSSSISTTFCRENASIISKWQKMLFGSLSNHVFCCCSVTKLCPALCNPMACSTPGFFVLLYLLEFAQTHVSGVSDAIQPSYPLSHPFPPALNLSQGQGLFQ